MQNMQAEDMEEERRSFRNNDETRATQSGRGYNNSRSGSGMNEEDRDY